MISHLFASSDVDTFTFTGWTSKGFRSPRPGDSDGFRIHVITHAENTVKFP
jgi:hypothetical protein